MGRKREGVSRKRGGSEWKGIKLSLSPHIFSHLYVDKKKYRTGMKLERESQQLPTTYSRESERDKE